MQYDPTFTLHYSNSKIQDSTYNFFQIFFRADTGPAPTFLLGSTMGNNTYSVCNIYYILMSVKRAIILKYLVLHRIDENFPSIKKKPFDKLIYQMTFWRRREDLNLRGPYEP